MNRTNTTDALEDKLQEGNVFVSGINGRPTHSDSYMTVLDFVALDKAWETIKDSQSKEEWELACAYWVSQKSICPILCLLGLTIKRKLI